MHRVRHGVESLLLGFVPLDEIGPILTGEF
jgi:hypothetical protein